MFLGFVGVIILGIVGALFLYIFQAPGADKFVSFIFNSLLVLSSAATMLWGLNKVHNQQEKTDEELKSIKAQTNGSLSARDERIRELENENAELRVEAAIATTQINYIQDGNNGKSN
jgi:Co/Zn/Cd efflux system component